MLYFKHPELVTKHHVSLKTVHNWIYAAKQGKLDLQLHDQDGRTYIANTPGNVVTLKRLAEKGKKYRNTLHHKFATPTPAFYKLYSRKQILDIISSINIHREIPFQYNYLDGGASQWDKYFERMGGEKTPNLPKSTIELLRANFSTIDLILQDHNRINIIDIGPGNALPVKELLAHLLKHGVLHRYIAIDISKEMLQIVESNIKEWFDGKVKFEGYVRDITYERFDDLLVDDMLDEDSEQTVNIAMLLGGTLENFSTPYDVVKIICNSMGPADLLIHTDKPDSETAQRYFNLVQPASSNPLSPKNRSTLERFTFDLLNIDESLYDIERGYNEQRRIRYVRVRLKVALTIKFVLENGERDVRLEKGETIVLWHFWHRTALEIISEFEKAGFTMLQASMTKNRQYLLTISGIEAKSSVES